MEPIDGSETSAFRTQTPGNYPKENTLHKEHGESLKSRNSPLFFIRTLLDTILSQLTPVGHTPIIRFGAFAKHHRKSTFIFTSERLNVFRHASRLTPPELLLLHIYFYFYKFGIAIPILVKLGRNDKQFTGRRKHIYGLSPSLVFKTEMDCASWENEPSPKKQLSIIIMGCKPPVLSLKFIGPCIILIVE